MAYIAITTMTGSANYGNALQNYAVLKLIEACGYEAETLRITTKNGYPDAAGEGTPLIKKLAPSYIRMWLHGRQNSVCGAKNDRDFVPAALRSLKANKKAWQDASQKKQAIFNAFQTEVLKYTDFEINCKNFNLKELEKYAAFVTGSDQVWNPYYHTNSVVEFLPFAAPEKRIAFAPSFGVSEIPESRCKEYSQWISDIPYLSVRENAGAKIIKELTGREAKVLLDPTFGLTSEEWLEFAREPEHVSVIPGKYVFCYFLGNRIKSYTEYIKSYADTHDCIIVDVWDVQQIENYSYDPREFVWLLANAKAVFTDSFHGAAFSINLQKPFVVFDRVGDGCITQSSRISTVLGNTGLTDRKSELLPAAQVDEIDFSRSSGIISQGRKEMVDFLADALSNACNSRGSVNLTTKRHCTGCGACMNACPQNAIRMSADGEGFLYPEIDQSKCISCRACEKVCPADRLKPDTQKTKAYYAYSKDEQLCRASSSGGIFSELAESVISDGGVVFGAGFDENFKVCHQQAETVDESAKLRTSKYVQSDIGNTYKAVKTFLENGRQVLFSGTPCQAAALKNYLGKEYDALLTVDIICHGVPSPGVWKEYLEQEHEAKGICNISFRNKDLGWNDFSMRIDYSDGTYYRQLATADPFEKAFLANLTLRPSCYQCQYKTVDRVSDITIADYWGVETVHPELKEQQGVSLVLTHSKKGEEALEVIRGSAVIGSTDPEKAAGMNSAWTHSVAWPGKRNAFFASGNSLGVKKAVEECTKLTAEQKAKKLLIRAGVKVKGVLRKVGIVK